MTSYKGTELNDHTLVAWVAYALDEPRAADLHTLAAALVDGTALTRLVARVAPPMAASAAADAVRSKAAKFKQQRAADLARSLETLRVRDAQALAQRVVVDSGLQRHRVACRQRFYV